MPGRLEVQRPSPTTVSFTYCCVRFCFFCVIGVGIARVRNFFFQEDGRVISWPAVWSSPLGSKLCRLVDSYNPLAIAVASAFMIYGVFRRGYIEESLLVIRGFGIQTSTSSSTYLSTASTRFIPTTQIQDIVIHEAFKGFEVRFYLAVIVEGEPDAGGLPAYVAQARDLRAGLERFSAVSLRREVMIYPQPLSQEIFVCAKAYLA
ncbi:hypothetical protein HAV15_011662 [Penicillium sp. str. |nr:hypothetical protein HAV15_011662 [Penicillium sp. str. \